jgi:hypothetical protein
MSDRIEVTAKSAAQSRGVEVSVKCDVEIDLHDDVLPMGEALLILKAIRVKGEAVEDVPKVNSVDWRADALICYGGDGLHQVTIRIPFRMIDRIHVRNRNEG